MNSARPDSKKPQKHVAPHDLLQHQMAQMWEELLHAENIGIWDDFFDLGGNSELAEQLISRIDMEFGLRLPISVLAREATIQALCDALRDVAPTSMLLELQTGVPSLRRPFFYFHGDFLTCGLYVHALVRGLDTRQPVYALQPHGLADGDSIPGSFEEMAEDQVRILRGIQPNGPYLLGGHCGGGLIAFEAARILERQGEKTDLLTLIHCYPVQGVLATLPVPTALRVVKHKVTTPRLRNAWTLSRYIDRMVRYVPRAYAGTVTLLGGTEASPFCSDPVGAWRKVAAGVAIYPIPGNHHTSVTRHVREASAALDACLRDTRQSSNTSRIDDYCRPSSQK